MNAKQLNKLFARAMYCMVIVAMVFSVTGTAFAEDESPPPPSIRAHPVEDSVDAWFWPEDATLYLSIDDPNTEESPDLEMDMPGTVDPDIGSVWFYFADTYDLKPGDLVTLTDGVTTRSLTVSILSIDAVDLEADTISGRVEPESQVRLPVPSELYVKADSNGYWFADFGQIGADLQPGTMFIAEVFDDDGDNSSFEQWIPSPWFSAFPEGDFVEGWDWPMDADIHMTIEDPGTEDSPDFAMDGNVVPTPWDPDSGATWLWIDFSGTYDMKPGDVVTLTDGVTERTHVVQSLDITEINLDENQVYGTTDGEKNVTLWSWEDPDGRRIETTSDGNWGVDFDDIGFTLEPGYHVRAEVWIDGNNTAVDRYITNPRFTVFPEWEWFDGIDWPDGSTVFISVEGKDECSTEGTSWDYFFNGGFPEGCDVEIGDTVTFTNGETVRTHIVQNLSVTKVDQGEDIVKGTADAGAEVYVWPHATGEQQLVTANPKRKWNVDFTGIYDLMTGDGGRAEIRDGFGNATAVDWYIPQPRFTIFPDAQWFDGIDWPDGATVTIMVKNKPECTFTRESWGSFFNGGFPEGCQVAAGDHVTFTDGASTRKHTVRNLAITMIDKEDDTVMGIADTGTVVHIWVWNSDGSTLDGSNFEVIAVDGMWQADYKALGIDLEIGMGIQAEIRDENGNATSVDLLVPDPRIVGSITEDWFYLADFLPGSSLDLSIYERQGGDLIWSSAEQEIMADVNGFAWIDSEDRWDLEPDYYLVVSDGNTTKALVIEGFTFDLFNLANGHLEGTAPEPFGRRVWVGVGFPEDGWSTDVTTDGIGAWYADFDMPVPSNYQWVAAQIFDDDGDATELRPAEIIP